MRDPYKFLNVPYGVDEATLGKRYREFASKLHGDAGGSDEMMKLVNEARAQIRKHLKEGIKFKEGDDADALEEDAIDEEELRRQEEELRREEQELRDLEERIRRAEAETRRQEERLRKAQEEDRLRRAAEEARRKSEAQAQRAQRGSPSSFGETYDSAPGETYTQTRYSRYTTGQKAIMGVGGFAALLLMRSCFFSAADRPATVAYSPAAVPSRPAPAPDPTPTAPVTPKPLERGELVVSAETNTATLEPGYWYHLHMAGEFTNVTFKFPNGSYSVYRMNGSDGACRHGAFILDDPMNWDYAVKTCESRDVRLDVEGTQKQQAPAVAATSAPAQESEPPRLARRSISLQQLGATYTLNPGNIYRLDAFAGRTDVQVLSGSSRLVRENGDEVAACTGVSYWISYGPTGQLWTQPCAGFSATIRVFRLPGGKSLAEARQQNQGNEIAEGIGNVLGQIVGGAIRRH